MKSDYECIQILDETNDKDNKELLSISNLTNKKTKKPKIISSVLKNCYIEDENIFEIGVDEVGRGPLFGRVYSAAVILPKDGTFDCKMVKDSKKFHSKKKIEEASDYIKKNALAWYISFEDEKKIDEINILQATQLSMHHSILEIRKQLNKKFYENGKIEKKDYNYHLLIDGNYFKPYTYLDKKTNKLESISHITVEGGDNKYASIAAASILAKVERDKYIEDLCNQNPNLIENYGIDSNKGYGAKKHLDGIKEHGITIWHRRTFGICKNYI